MTFVIFQLKRQHWCRFQQLLGLECVGVGSACSRSVALCAVRGDSNRRPILQYRLRPSTGTLEEVRTFYHSKPRGRWGQTRVATPSTSHSVSLFPRLNCINQVSFSKNLSRRICVKSYFLYAGQILTAQLFSPSHFDLVKSYYL